MNIIQRGCDRAFPSTVSLRTAPSRGSRCQGGLIGKHILKREKLDRQNSRVCGAVGDGGTETDMGMEESADAVEPGWEEVDVCVVSWDTNHPSLAEDCRGSSPEASGDRTYSVNNEHEDPALSGEQALFSQQYKYSIRTMRDWNSFWIRPFSPNFNHSDSILSVSSIFKLFHCHNCTSPSSLPILSPSSAGPVCSAFCLLVQPPAAPQVRF